MATSKEIVKPDVEKTITKLNLSLAVLMGLPASGKTTLAKKIQVECSHQKTAVIIMSFDEFIPHDVQAQCALQSENNVAKLVRKSFVKCVDITVVELLSWEKQESLNRSEKDWEHLLPQSPETEHLISRKSLISKISNSFKKIREQLDQLNKNEVDPVAERSVILLIDDNNYYSSMRNEFYQIAKFRRTGFSILYCKTSVRTCRKRNSERNQNLLSDQVPDKTIVEMSLKLEEPNPMGTVCDSFCVQIDENVTEAGDAKQDNIPLIMEVLKNSLKSPIDWSPPDRSEEIERERRICSENEIHQADLVLRKWVNKELAFSTLLKSNSSKNKREISRDLIRKKNVVLENLRSGESRLSFGVDFDVEFTQEVTNLVKDVHLQ